MLGWQTVAAVEIDPSCRDILLRRQRDGCLSEFPIWDDVCTFDGKPWRGLVDVVSGGFPCQDISAAGKGSGITGERSGLWSEMARIVGEVRPRFVFVENSPMLVRRGLAVVLGDLASLGYDARWCVLGADDVGAPHKRKRIWMLANANGEGLEGRERQELPERARELSSRKGGSWWSSDPADMAGPNGEYGGRGTGREDGAQAGNRGQELDYPNELGYRPPQDEVCPGSDADLDAGRWGLEPRLGRVAHGVAHDLDESGTDGEGEMD